MNLEILHDIDGHRFSVTVEGYQCVLDYRLADAVMTITHTGVPQKIEGRGIAAALTTAALDAARAAGWKVVPACSYAAAFMRRHPEYEDLRLRH
jgi:predicted GNAT family acetyltransferase